MHPDSLPAVATPAPPRPVIVLFTRSAPTGPVPRGSVYAGPPRFRIVCRQESTPRVEVLSHDALGAERWIDAAGFTREFVCEMIARALVVSHTPGEPCTYTASAVVVDLGVIK